MSPESFDFDVFISHASEDLEWTLALAKRLKGEGVRVWLDHWQLQAGDRLNPRIEEGTQRSRRTAVVWTKNYFREDKVWTQAEMWARHHTDVLGRQRLLLPILREEVTIPALVADIKWVDFRDDQRFDEAVGELIRALGLEAPALTTPRSTPAPKPKAVPDQPESPAMEMLGPILKPLLIFLGFAFICGMGFGLYLCEKGYVALGVGVAGVFAVGTFGLLVLFLMMQARGFPLSQQEWALQRNAPQIMADHARSGAA